MDRWGYERRGKRWLTSSGGWARANLYYDRVASGAAPVPHKGTLRELVWIQVFYKRQSASMNRTLLLSMSDNAPAERRQQILESLLEDLFPSAPVEQEKHKEKVRALMEKSFQEGPLQIKLG